MRRAQTSGNARRVRRGPSRRGCTRWCVMPACGGHSGVSSGTRELCERWLSQAASVSEARACRRDAAQTRKHAEPACTQRAGEPLCTTPRAVASASPPSFLARVLRGSSRFLSTPSTPDRRPARPARRHTRAARSPRRAARTARLEQQEQLEKQPSLCRSSMPSLHTENPVAMLASVRASTGRRTRLARATDAARAGGGSSCRTQPAAAAAACRAGAGNSGRHSIFRARNSLPCLALPWRRRLVLMTSSP